MYGSKRKRRLHSVAVLLGPLSFGLTILLLEWFFGQGLESKSVFFKQCIEFTAFLQVIDEQFRKLSNGWFIRS